MQTHTNLKILNEDMPYIHFKMEMLQSVLSLITPECCLASLDPKDAYYSVPIHQNHTKFLKFILKNELYMFLIHPNGLCCANVGLTFDECVKNAITSIKFLNSLGFIIHPDKSMFLWKQEKTFLRFNINSQKMEITLSDTKKQPLKACWSELIQGIIKLLGMWQKWLP